jgi:hypothetical protein
MIYCVVLGPNPGIQGSEDPGTPDIGCSRVLGYAV